MILEKLNSLIFNFFFNKLWLKIPFKQCCGQCSESAYPMALAVKNLPVNAGNIRDAGSIPGSGRSSGGGNGDLLQYSCLENHMDRGAWWVVVHGVTKSQIQLK